MAEWSLAWPTSEKSDELHTAGLVALVAEIAPLRGAIVECGVMRGRSLVTLARAAELHAPGSEVVGFDSFEGFPPAHEADVGSRISQPGERLSGYQDLSYELVIDVLDAPCTVVKGFFEDTLRDGLPERIALLHVDADLYESVTTVLREAHSKLLPGAIILLDEHHRSDRFPGAKRAAEEYAASSGRTIEWHEPVGRFLIRVPAAVQGHGPLASPLAAGESGQGG